MSKRRGQLSLGAFLIAGHHVAALRLPSASNSTTLEDLIAFTKIAEAA
ncbi:MAG: hypothetical protein ABSC06_22120 [Rhodopila sp.]|jgi:hypothetical protein